MGLGNFTLKLTFSEPILNPTVEVNGIAPPSLVPSGLPGQQRIFTGTLAIDAGTTDGTKTLEIRAKDLGGNDLLALGPSDVNINPATQLVRNAGGTMQGTGGPDTSVNIIRKRLGSLDEPA